VPNAAENLTISSGVRFSLGLPPIVPLMPEMLLVNATKKRFNRLQKYRFKPNA
jgi:hypothetical protein